MRDKIRFYRFKHELNQTQFGALVGKSRGTVSAWERGLFKPTDSETKQRLIEILGVKI